ncbi:MAG: PepSY domain-containing protein [Roseovarius sp.]
MRRPQSALFSALFSSLFLAALLPAGAALADDDDCRAPRDRWQPREAAIQAAESNGWSVRKFKIDDGCYKIKGRDEAGRDIEAKLDPATLQVIKSEYEDDDDRSDIRAPAPAGTAAPPRNGLFGTTTPPKAEVN